MITQSGFNPARLRPSVPVDLGRLGPAIKKLLDDAHSAVERDSDAVRSCLARALAMLREETSHDGDRTLPPAPRHSRGGLAPWQAQRVMTYLEAHLDEPIRIAELATLSRLSVSYFSVAFRRSFGSSLRTFLAGLRIERAQMLMLSTDQPLSQIALGCGFCDQAHLSRQFRRVVGRTPRSWRREHIGQPAM